MKLLATTLLLIILVSCSTFVNKHNTKIERGNIDVDEKLHPKNSLEWWYLTGFLEGDNGKKYGVEYVFFSFRALDCRQRYMVNVAISNPEDAIFIYDHEVNLSKDYLNQEIPLHFDTKRYQFSGEKGSYLAKASMKDHRAGFVLETTPTQPVVYHQDSGYVQYGGIASAGYYSYPRLQTEGQLFIENDTINVIGTTWYDRQWDGGNVYRRKVAWDWTAINLSDSTELMLYRVNEHKTDKIELGGSYIKKDHSLITLKSEDIIFEPLTYWTSPKSKKKYPIKWNIEIPKIDLKAIMVADINDQEVFIKNWLKVFYWEGMCSLSGYKSDKPISGEAYLEMNNR